MGEEMSECVTIGNATMHHGDCRDVMRAMAADSVDAIVTDPPYGLGFMGKDWDHGIPGEHFWSEALRVAKPGAHLLAFGGTRTFHRLACAIEDAGWEIRDCVMWVYGSGFPKSLDVSKAIDKAAGVERVRLIVPTKKGNAATRSTAATDMQTGFRDLGEPATEFARQWQGWGTALKPAWEPIIVARKPLIGSVAENVLKHGTGALNIDGCRIEGAGPSGLKPFTRSTAPPVYALGMAQPGRNVTYTDHPSGRWPANLIHDGSDEVVALFPETTSGTFSGHRNLPKTKNAFGQFAIEDERSVEGSTGSAARFFYCAKASKADRDGLIDGLPLGDPPASARSKPAEGRTNALGALRQNHHPTVKPTDLMRYLCRLVTPPGGVVLDPFTGSGSTGVAALAEGFRFIGVEIELEYLSIARERLSNAQRQERMFA